MMLKVRTFPTVLIFFVHKTEERLSDSLGCRVVLMLHRHARWQWVASITPHSLYYRNITLWDIQLEAGGLRTREETYCLCRESNHNFLLMQLVIVVNHTLCQWNPFFISASHLWISVWLLSWKMYLNLPHSVSPSDFLTIILYPFLFSLIYASPPASFIPLNYCEHITANTLLWTHYYEHITMNTILWTHYCEHITVDPLLWTHYCEHITVNTLVWTHYCKHITVNTLLWTHYCKQITVNTLLWTHYCKHIIVNTILWTHYCKHITVNILLWTHYCKHVSLNTLL
jgi:hypothetical protein